MYMLKCSEQYANTYMKRSTILLVHATFNICCNRTAKYTELTENNSTNIIIKCLKILYKFSCFTFHNSFPITQFIENSFIHVQNILEKYF